MRKWGRVPDGSKICFFSSPMGLRARELCLESVEAQ